MGDAPSGRSTQAISVGLRRCPQGYGTHGLRPLLLDGDPGLGKICKRYLGFGSRPVRLLRPSQAGPSGPSTAYPASAPIPRATDQRTRDEQREGVQNSGRSTSLHVPTHGISEGGGEESVGPFLRELPRICEHDRGLGVAHLKAGKAISDECGRNVLEGEQRRVTLWGAFIRFTLVSRAFGPGPNQGSGRGRRRRFADAPDGTPSKLSGRRSGLVRESSHKSLNRTRPRRASGRPR